jgi:hypothetical protein
VRYVFLKGRCMAALTTPWCHWRPSYLTRVRPLALRPRLTPGLPFSVLLWPLYRALTEPTQAILDARLIEVTLDAAAAVGQLVAAELAHPAGESCA